MQKINDVVLWAVKVADENNVGIQGVIASYLSAREQLKDSNKAMEFVESEAKSKEDSKDE